MFCYRYAAIIFSHNASPFILNCMIKFHASTFPVNKCTKTLSSKFYTDHFVKTCNSESELTDLYYQAVNRLRIGIFHRQSCNSNCPKLWEVIKQDSSLMTHYCPWETVLGYRYNPKSNSINLTQWTYDPELNTKHLILSAVFNPSSLFLPLTIQSWLLTGEVWKLGLDWGEPLPKDQQWSRLARELPKLHSFKFDRQVLDEDSSVDLYLFSDASKRAYGFTVYVVQNGKSSLVLSLLKSKTSPTLELLTSFLALKCLSNILKAYQNVNFKNLYLVVDAQIVHTCFLS